MVAVIPLPPLSYVEVGLVVLFVTFIEYLLPINEYLAGKHVYFYMSYASLVVISIGMFGALDYNSNIILMRAAPDGNSAHFLSLLAIVLVLYRFGYNDIIKGLSITGAFVAFHELISVGFTLITGAYGASLGITPEQALTFYSTFLFMCATIVVAYFVFDKGKTWKHMYWAMVLLVMYSMIVVFSVGAVGTLNILGPTQYFQNMLKNGVEDGSWILPSIALIVASMFGPSKHLSRLPDDISGEQKA